jgi:hypothetical protein
VALLVALWLQAPAPPAPDTGWLGLQAGFVELALAHDHGGGRLDGGLLTVDPNRRVVLWQGIPGPMGCPDRIEARFDDVRRVEAADGPGLRVQFRKPIGRTLVLIPRPHARWLRERPRVTDPSTMSRVANEAAQGPSGNIPLIGDMVSAGPTVQRMDLPRDVTADTRIAIDAIREALGRTVTPGAALHEALHGTPRDLLLAEILAAPADHEGHAVRTVGVVGGPPSEDGATDLIAGGLTLRVQPAREVTKLWTALARTWVGREVEVTGVLGRGVRAAGRGPAATLSVWDFAPTDQKTASAGEVPAVALGDVVEGKQGQGGLVRVVGLFRGHNLFGDMEGNPPDARAWVLKSGAHAVWIVGKPPSGPGWKLDPAEQQDAAYGLEVVGRVSRHRGRARIHARSVALIAPPPEAQVAAAPPQVRLVTGMSADPPVVVFALPMDGETELPPHTRFVVQFSKYMDAASFQGRVRVRHAGVGGAVRELPNVRLAYDDSRRALVVDPGEVLEAGARVECVLLPGIADQQGIALAPRPGRREEGAVDVLRFGIAG